MKETTITYLNYYTVVSAMSCCNASSHSEVLEAEEIMGSIDELNGRTRSGLAIGSTDNRMKAITSNILEFPGWGSHRQHTAGPFCPMVFAGICQQLQPGHPGTVAKD